MSRSAAGRAGGRPAAAGADRTRPRVLLRAVLLPLLTAPLLLGPLPGGLQGTAPRAQAAPAVQDAPVQPGVPGDEDTRDDARPVRIDVGRFEPRTVTPGAVITLAGTLTNTGTSTITDLAVRLQRGEVRTSRAELAAADRDPDPATTVEPAFQEVDGTLAPGDDLEFSYTVPSFDLEMTEDGVYPVLVNVNGAVDGEDRERVGELSTFLVQQPVVPQARTAVAWLWPLVDVPHRSASGGFRNDDLADSIASGGRLYRAVAVLERLPGGAPVDGSGAAPALPVALAVDPALL